MPVFFFPADYRGSPFIGFTSWKTNEQTVIGGELVNFQGVLLNSENGYNSGTSTFTCPCHGIYLVSLTMKIQEKGGLQGTVRSDVHGNIISVYNSEFNEAGNTMSNSGLVSCKAGERLNVRGYEGGAVKGNANIPFSTFTVMMLDNLTDSEYNCTFIVLFNSIIILNRTCAATTCDLIEMGKAI